ncbi:MAG: hypothetical protein IT557_04840 [Alphaproteobacteria bacterium]|nr:hypothetical protein [Alphaproteobacteria bacterium]
MSAPPTDPAALKALAAAMGLAKLQADHPADFAEAARLAPEMIAKITRGLAVPTEPSLVTTAPAREPRR